MSEPSAMSEELPSGATSASLATNVATDAELKPILRELDEVATGLNNGVPAPGDEGCGLQQTHLYLNQIAPYSPGYEGA